MASTVSSPPQPSKRLACTRCHQQKLRCHRNPLPGRPCARCANAGTECRFEPPLRPGRPSSRAKLQSQQSSAKGTANAIAINDKLTYGSGRQGSSEERQDVVMGAEGLESSTRCDNPETGAIDPMSLLYGSPYVATDPALLFDDLPTNHDWMQLPISESSVHQAQAHPTPPSSGPARESTSPPQSTAAVTGGAIYRLVELTRALHECYSALPQQSPDAAGAGESTYTEQGRDTMLVDLTPRIDKILSLTQSLTDTLSSMLNHRPYTSANSHQNTKVVDPSTLHSSKPDTPTILMTLACYLRLLHIYNSLFKSAKMSKTFQPPSSNRSPPICPEPIQNTLHFQIGCFSASGAPSTSLLACLSAHLLENLETALGSLASYAAQSSKVRAPQWETESGPAASVAILAKAAVSEARSVQLDLRQQLQVASSAGLFSPPVPRWG